MNKRLRIKDNKSLQKLLSNKKENFKNSLEWKEQRLKREFKSFQSILFIILVITQTKLKSLKLPME